MGHLLTVLAKKRIIAQDGFNRADNASSMGSANTGQVWVPSTGTWGISGNQATVIATSGITDRSIADIGASDFTLSTTLITVKDNQRILFRYTDTSNEWMLGVGGTLNYYINKRVANSNLAVASYSTTPVIGDRIKIMCRGSLIKLFVNGLLVISVTDSFNSTATKIGFAGVNDATIKFDDLFVEEI